MKREHIPDTTEVFPDGYGMENQRKHYTNLFDYYSDHPDDDYEEIPYEIDES